MVSRIQELLSEYRKFENILPEELSDTDFTQLEKIKDQFKSIMDEDLDTIKKLSLEKKVAINIQEFRKPDHIVKMGFFRDGDTSQNLVQFYFAHWYMSMITMERLSKSIIELSCELSKYYIEYSKMESTLSERKKNYNYYVRTWQDFFGYLISIYNTIYDYYDLFIRLNKQLDPGNKDNTYYAFKSDEGPGELQAGVKELLLHGNRGRLTGFSLLRTMIEISVVRELFNTKKSINYKGKEIMFKNNSVISVNAICNSINRLGYAKEFKTDTIMRIYDWGSIVSHRAFRTDDYLTWFFYGIVGELCNLFYWNMEKYRDRILDELQRTGQIEIKNLSK